jgi:hypothetical protein
MKNLSIIQLDERAIVKPGDLTVVHPDAIERRAVDLMGVRSDGVLASLIIYRIVEDDRDAKIKALEIEVGSLNEIVKAQRDREDNSERARVYEKCDLNAKIKALEKELDEQGKTLDAVIVQRDEVSKHRGELADKLKKQEAMTDKLLDDFRKIAISSEAEMARNADLMGRLKKAEDFAAGVKRIETGFDRFDHNARIVSLQSDLKNEFDARTKFEHLHKEAEEIIEIHAEKIKRLNADRDILKASCDKASEKINELVTEAARLTIQINQIRAITNTGVK